MSYVHFDKAKNDFVTDAGRVANSISKVITRTLTSGSTTITVNDPIITDSAVIDVYTDIYGVVPSAIVQSGNSLEITFPSQSTDMTVKVTIGLHAYMGDVTDTLEECLDAPISGKPSGSLALKQATTYSTDEVCIGESFGKKRYRKCYDMGTVACTTSVQTKTLDTALTTSNIDKVFDLYSTFVNTNGSYCLNNTSDNSAYIRPYVATNGLLASVKGSASGNLTRCLVVIEYTKVGD